MRELIIIAHVIHLKINMSRIITLFIGILTSSYILAQHEFNVNIIN